MNLSGIRTDKKLDVFDNVNRDDLSEQVIVLVGDNGIGKTQILKKISAYIDENSDLAWVAVDADQLPNHPNLTKMVGQCIKDPDLRTKLFELLVTAEPQFIDLSIKNNQLMAQVTWSREPINASQLGRGFNQLLKIGAAVLTTTNGFVFIDDIECFLHHRTQAVLVSFIQEVDKNNQYFITTNSSDFIKYMASIKTDNKMSKSVVRLGEVAKYSTKGAVCGNIFSDTEASKLISLGMDIR